MTETFLNIVLAVIIYYQSG